MKKALLPLFLILSACGEPSLYEIGRMHVHADSGVIVPTKHELQSFLETYRAFTGLKALPWTLRFVNEIDDCATEGCDGQTFLAQDTMSIVAQPCLGTTSLAHELTHFGIYQKTGNVNKADSTHKSPMFHSVDIDLCNALCDVGCRTIENVGY
jgi:hypothetical protein